MTPKQAEQKILEPLIKEILEEAFQHSWKEHGLGWIHTYYYKGPESIAEALRKEIQNLGWLCVREDSLDCQLLKIWSEE